MDLSSLRCHFLRWSRFGQKKLWEKNPDLMDMDTERLIRHMSGKGYSKTLNIQVGIPEDRSEPDVQTWKM